MGYADTVGVSVASLQNLWTWLGKAVPPPRGSVACSHNQTANRHDSEEAMRMDEIVNELIRLLRMRDEHGGHFQQEPYKGDFFRLFEAAFQAGLLNDGAPTSLKLDSLISIISVHDSDVFDGQTWRMFSAAWPEWDYAWSHTRRASSSDERRALASREALNWRLGAEGA
jgi:hypothetical protein